MPRGGKRPGAGRKSNTEIKTIRALIDDNVQADEWQAIVRNLVKDANEGNLRATQLLLTYRYGDPYAEQPAPLPQEGPARENSLWLPDNLDESWYIQIHPVNDIMVLVENEANCTYDAEGNVLILRRTLYNTGDIPPFIPAEHDVYTPRDSVKTPTTPPPE